MEKVESQGRVLSVEMATVDVTHQTTAEGGRWPPLCTNATTSKKKKSTGKLNQRNFLPPFASFNGRRLFKGKLATVENSAQES